MLLGCFLVRGKEICIVSTLHGYSTISREAALPLEDPVTTEGACKIFNLTIVVGYKMIFRLQKNCIS